MKSEWQIGRADQFDTRGLVGGGTRRTKEVSGENRQSPGHGQGSRDFWSGADRGGVETCMRSWPVPTGKASNPMLKGTGLKFQP